MKGDSSLSAQDRIKVLLDTDIGSDIDDAVCLAYRSASRAAICWVSLPFPVASPRGGPCSRMHCAVHSGGKDSHPQRCANPLLGVQRQPKTRKQQFWIGGTQA